LSLMRAATRASNCPTAGDASAMSANYDGEADTQIANFMRCEIKSSRGDLLRGCQQRCLRSCNMCNSCHDCVEERGAVEGGASRTRCGAAHSHGTYFVVNLMTNSISLR
jgi:hypothetical protein